MYSAKYIALALILYLFVMARGQVLEISTPSQVINCEENTLSWSGGAAPYQAWVFSSEAKRGILVTLPETNATSALWGDYAFLAGTSVTFQVADASGTVVWSDPVTVTGSDECEDS